MKKLHALIPAGGPGARLWPVSRQGKPKFLLDMLGTGYSLLQETVFRLAPFSESITVVTGIRHLATVQAQLQEAVDSKKLPVGLPVSVVAEPSARDSMAAIGLGTYLLGRKYGPAAVVGAFPADHAIPNLAPFYEAVQDAIGAAEAGYLATLGVRPTEPSTAFGYIDPTGDQVAPGAFLVKRFVEKPGFEAAQQYVEEGYLWNAGMFVMTVDTLQKGLGSNVEAMDRGLTQIVSSWNLLEQQQVLSQVWPTLQRISFDYAIAEPLADEGRVAVSALEGSGWTDLGDFKALAETETPPDPAGQHVVIDSPGALVRAPADKAVVVIGMPDAVVIDTPDALLVTTKDQAQKVREGVDSLESRGFRQYL